MEVLILSKTEYGSLRNMVCVGGMIINTNQYVRLLNSDGRYQYADTELNIGDIWNIDFTPGINLQAPHNEDVLINSKTYIRTIENISEIIVNSGVRIWRGNVNNIFDGNLQWTNPGKGFFSANNQNILQHSVGFWISDQPLRFEFGNYIYPTTNFFENRILKYKGIQDPINPIPANTLIRLSLAKWWKPEDKPEMEERCYLQLSGWYD